MGWYLSRLVKHRLSQFQDHVRVTLGFREKGGRTGKRNQPGVGEGAAGVGQRGSPLYRGGLWEVGSLGVSLRELRDAAEEVVGVGRAGRPRGSGVLVTRLLRSWGLQVWKARTMYTTPGTAGGSPLLRPKRNWRGGLGASGSQERGRRGTGLKSVSGREGLGRQPGSSGLAVQLPPRRGPGSQVRRVDCVENSRPETHKDRMGASAAEMLSQDHDVQEG